MLDGWIVRDRLDEIRDKNKLENYECDQLDKFCKDQKYAFEVCMAEIVRLVSEKDKEKGVDVQYVEIVNESMYIRPEFRNGAGYNRDSRSRFKPDMSKYSDYKVRFRNKDPNDPNLYRNRSAGGTVSGRSRSRSEYSRGKDSWRSRSGSQTRYVKGGQVYRDFSPGSGFRDRSRSRGYRKDEGSKMEEVRTRLAEVVHKGDCSKHKTAVEMFNLF